MLSNLADMMIALYAAESALLRTAKIIDRLGEEKAANPIEMTRVYVREALREMEQKAKETLLEAAEGDALRTQLSVLKKFVRASHLSTLRLKRNIAARVIENERYTVI